MCGYIYLTTNLTNKKKYIGRKQSDKFLGTSYLGSGVHLKRAVEKYGRDKFRVDLLYKCDSYDELVRSEAYFIKLFDAVNSESFYNQSYGGYAEGWVFGDENIAKADWCRKINSQKHIGNPGYWKGKHLTDSAKQKLREFRTGRGLSDETKRKLSIITRNRNLSRQYKDMYDKVSKTKTGTFVVHNDVECVRIKPEQLADYLSRGYERGFLKFSHKDVRGKNNPNYGKVGVHNGTKAMHLGETNKYIKLEEIDEYSQRGWSLGLYKHKK